MPEGVPPVGSPPDSPKATGEPTGGPKEDTEMAREVDCPSETVAGVDLDKMPPLEEDEAIAELDAAIDKAGDEGEEGPKPLDEVDISKVAQHIKDDPMLHLALGLTEPYWASMALAVGVRKLHEYEALKNNRRRSQVLSYGRLAARYGMNEWSQTATGVRRLSHHLPTGRPIDAPIQHEILSPFQDHHFVPKVKYPLRRSFYRLSRSHRFNMESLSQFSLTMVKDLNKGEVVSQH